MPDSARSIRDTLVQLEIDAFNPRLRTHKLKGELSDRWSCSAGYDLRIVFRFVQQEGAESILLLSVGTHDEVY
jgi:mRNA interferase YafQ